MELYRIQLFKIDGFRILLEFQNHDHVVHRNNKILKSYFNSELSNTF